MAETALVVEIAFFSEATVRVAEGPIIQCRLFSPGGADGADFRHGSSTSDPELHCLWLHMVWQPPPGGGWLHRFWSFAIPPLGEAATRN